MRNKSVKQIALGGLLAAVATVIMCMGGLIPVATFLCPVLCILICYMVCCFCGGRLAWAWYICVAILSVLLGPDKEAAAVFLFLGHYPIWRQFVQKIKFGLLLKLLYFNSSVCIMYVLLMYTLGVQQLLADYSELGIFGLIVLLVLGNITFILVDRLLGIFGKRMQKHGK